MEILGLVMLHFFTAANRNPMQGRPTDKWAIYPGLNAVPSTSVGVLSGTTSSMEACRSSCSANGSACTIFTWNSKSGHCFWRLDGVWNPIDDNDRVESGCVVAPPSRAVDGCPQAPSPSPPTYGNASLPLLFLDLLDVEAPRGRMKPVASSAHILTHLSLPPLNYSGGATIFAAFDIGGAYEIFAAVGRPGEPIARHLHPTEASPPQGVSVLRFTSTDLKTYSKPTQVLFLENGSGLGVGDGSIWTVKSCDRDLPAGAPSRGATYLLFASYGSSCHTFATRDVENRRFEPTTGDLRTPNFHDHDDTNVIYDRSIDKSGRWIDMQIMYEKWNKTYCDNVKGARRVVTVRDSRDGKTWSDDWGCLDSPQKDEHCHTFNTSAMVRPGDFRSPDDPEELEFYRVRPFYVHGRLVAHALLYVPSPSEVVTLPGYGRQPLWYCKHGCCHGPHMFEEWWIGPSSGDPSDISGWRRPYPDTRAFAHDVWAMAQPVVYNGSSVWVDNGLVWGVPQFRLGGLHTTSNAEFSTKVFVVPEQHMELWVEAEVMWGQKAQFGARDWCAGGCNGVGGSDEAHAAYLMVEVHDATGAVIPGFERAHCVFLNVSGTLPLRWTSNATTQQLGGRQVFLRFYFRDATVFALGHSLNIVDSF